ncbi:MAG: hypothetical protein ABJL67_14275 [Sulfitobacter sp.]
MNDNKLALSLLIMRLSIAVFFGAWSSLKFYRPEWFGNIFANFYGIKFVTADFATLFGIAQVLVVIAFAIGIWRTYSYSIIMLMHTAGVLGSIPSMMNYTKYPNNLMLTAIPTLGALIALLILRKEDRFSVDGWREGSKGSP